VVACHVIFHVTFYLISDWWTDVHWGYPLGEGNRRDDRGLEKQGLQLSLGDTRDCKAGREDR
jgi:hypothetical protein